jgi:putative heme-binding domain-containing protein
MIARPTLFLATIAFLGAATLCAQRSGRSLPGTSPDAGDRNPFSSEADIELGRKLYAGRCGHCHGQNGEGGRGAVLNTARLRHGNSDRDLFRVIRFGIPNSEMPGSFVAAEADIWRMAAYVKQLGGRATAETVSGDPAAGAAVYAKNGCARCHTIGTEGGMLGPDLSDLGAKRAIHHIRTSIVSPNGDIPLDYRSVEVTTSAGKSISGIHLNEDEYSVHLRDFNGDLLSFRKSELKEVRLPNRSLMPAYNLPAADLENLVAYLSSLGRPK